MLGNDTGVPGTQTMKPIALGHISRDCKITYRTMVYGHRTLKSEPNHCRLAVGADRLTYDNKTAALTASLLEAKLFSIAPSVPLMYDFLQWI